MRKSLFGPLIGALLDGDHARAVAEVRSLGAAGVAAELIVTAGIEQAMLRLDEKCTVEHFNLLEIMLAGRAAGAAIKELYPHGMPLGRGKTYLCDRHPGRGCPRVGQERGEKRPGG